MSIKDEEKVRYENAKIALNKIIDIINDLADIKGLKIIVYYLAEIFIDLLMKDNNISFQEATKMFHDILINHNENCKLQGIGKVIKVKYFHKH